MNPQVAMLAGGITIAGLALFRRGLGGYRTADRIADVGTSTISSMAVGEVRIAGTIEPAEVLLVSALQSVRCVYFRSTVEEGRDDASDGDIVEERSIGFRVRDVSGSVRVFPRGARFDAPLRFDASTDLTGDEPSGLDLRIGGATDVAERDRDALIAGLLRMPTAEGAMAGRSPFRREWRGRRRYRETRLEPGDAVTIVGRALPFGDLSDPSGADLGAGPDVPSSDPEIAADLAKARAWHAPGRSGRCLGQRRHPGFGIGRPVSRPTLDAEANPLPIAAADDAARVERMFRIAQGDLVLAAAPEAPLLIAHGTPAAAVDRHRETYLLGLLGASLAIVGAMLFAVMLSGGFGR